MWEDTKRYLEILNQINEESGEDLFRKGFKEMKGVIRTYYQETQLK